MTTRTAFTLIFLTAFILITGTALADSTCRPDWADPKYKSSCERLRPTITGSMEPGETVTNTFDLIPGNYSFAAWVSMDLVGLKMEIVDSATGSSIAGADEGDNMPICEINLSEAKKVDVRITGGKARVEGSKGGYALIAVSGVGCFKRQPCDIQQMLDDWTSVANEGGFNVIKWETRDISGIKPIKYSFKLTPGRYMIAAETLLNGDDIDLIVTTGKDTVLAKDDRPNGFPICEFELEVPADIAVQVEPWGYQNGTGTTYVFLVAVKSEK